MIEGLTLRRAKEKQLDSRRAQPDGPANVNPQQLPQSETGKRFAPRCPPTTVFLEDSGAGEERPDSAPQSVRVSNTVHTCERENEHSN